MLMVRPDRTRSGGAARPHGSGLDPRALGIPFLAFAALAWLASRAPVTSDVGTVTRSAILLLHHGSPYLPKARLVSWKYYNPYLPAMAIFGMPKAAGLPGLLGDPRPWLAAASAGVFALAFSIGMPHRATPCASCRGSVAWYAVPAVPSPVCPLPPPLRITP